MSIQFGTWNLDGQPVDSCYLDSAESIIAPYGPDTRGCYVQDHVAIVFRHFHTTKESRRETQPYISPLGTIITWDGRLDNRCELAAELENKVSVPWTDVDIVASAFECWGTAAFKRLIGDWALAIWNPLIRTLILAKDFLGTRQLYYSIDAKQIRWSTILDPLVQVAGRTFTLCEEYMAGWLSFFPATHLTPYVGIHSVPAASFVLLRPDSHHVTKYWDFDGNSKIRYGSDKEYEEHFRKVFETAVHRRLRSDIPILAELSGGMDSSSIVCMADVIEASGAADVARFDTLSYYNKSEPNWNEHSYFTRVEDKRGRMGHHIDLSSQELFNFDQRCVHFEAIPDSTAAAARNQAKQHFAMHLKSNGYRVVLSGIGGDETMGGKPTPTPELQDLLTRLRLRDLARQLASWALAQRVPWLHLLSEALRDFFPSALFGIPKERRPASWLTFDFVKQNKQACQGYERRLRVCGPLPSVQANVSALDHLRRQIASCAPSRDPLYEKRYPFLDRDLLEFIYSIPREQLVRPGRRRSLMRRAMIGIVPDEILERKRKAFVARSTRAAIAGEWQCLEGLTRDMCSAALGIVEQDIFRASLREARNAEGVPIVRLMRTISAEAWLRHLCDTGLLTDTSEWTRGRVLEPLQSSA